VETLTKLIDKTYEHSLENITALKREIIAAKSAANESQQTLIAGIVAAIAEQSAEKTNHEKGKQGEELVYEDLNMIDAAEITDTSKVGFAGDMQVKYNNLHALVEVKNHKSIKSTDVAAFTELVQKSKCNSGIFVSIRSSIPMKSNLHFDIIGKKCVCYVRRDSQATVQLALKALDMFMKLMKEHTEYKESQVNDSEVTMKEIGNVISAAFGAFEQMESMRAASVNAMQILRDNHALIKFRLENMTAEFGGLIRKYPTLKTTATPQLMKFTTNEIEKYSKLSASKRKKEHEVLKILHKTDPNYLTIRGGLQELDRLAEDSD
jgi:hypothetical protein